MISCDECQKKLVAVFDNEASEAEHKLISAHLKDCSQCRAFYEDMVRIRQQFVSVNVSTLPAAVEQELMRVAEADCLSSGASRSKKRPIREPVWLRFPRLAWACSIAALLIIALSALVCFILGREVVDLRGELAVARQDLVVARAEEQREDDRQREQRAITALYLRMAELEERVERFSSPRMTFLPTQ